MHREKGEGVGGGKNEKEREGKERKGKELDTVVHVFNPHTLEVAAWGSLS